MHTQADRTVFFLILYRDWVEWAGRSNLTFKQTQISPTMFTFFSLLQSQRSKEGMFVGERQLESLEDIMVKKKLFLINARHRYSPIF